MFYSALCSINRIGSVQVVLLCCYTGLLVLCAVLCVQVSQLRHDVSMKDELLQFYTSAAEESEGESVTSTP